MVLFQSLRTFLKLTSKSKEENEMLKECSYDTMKPTIDKSCTEENNQCVIAQLEATDADCDIQETKNPIADEVFCQIPKNVSNGLISSDKLYSSSKNGKDGKDSCKPKDPCPPKPKCREPPKKKKDPCPSKDKCKKEDPSKQKDPCGPKGPSKPVDPCKKSAKSESPCISRAPAGSVVCPTPCFPPPCCPPPHSCPDSGGKRICSPAVDGKVAIITGAAYGIGYNCAIAILKNNGKVMIGDVNVEAGKEALCKIIDMFGENKAAFIKCDVTNAREMECLFQAAECEFKQIDIVINNAGFFSNNLTDKTIDINTKGVVRGTFLGFQHMRKNKNGGTIINLGSIYSFTPFFGVPVYSATKGFVLGFSRSMGHDYFFKQTGVKVMTLCPGITITNMVEGLEEACKLEGFGTMLDSILKRVDELPNQSGEDCGMHIIPMLEAGINGSDWISEGNEVYRVKRVNRHKLRICEG